MDTFFGLVASCLTCLSLVSQLLTMYEQKEPAHISSVVFIILFVGLAAWIVYGIVRQDGFIVCFNIFSFIFNLNMYLLDQKYKKVKKNVAEKKLNRKQI